MRLIFKGTNYLPEYRGLHDGHVIRILAGESAEFSDAEAEKILRDFPVGVFVRDITVAPVDRQIKAPRGRK